MKRPRMYTAILLIVLLILNPAYAKADGSNDFTANLSVSDTTVTSGTTVTCTITVTNTDTTYGADVSISYNGQNIDSYYLSAGQTETTTHNITIYKTTDVYYTVYASHGPDISKTKDTNTVTVYVQEPDTATPPPTYTPYTQPDTATPSPADDTIEDVTPVVTTDAESDDQLGWGKPVKIENTSVRVMDNVFNQSIGDWLGMNKEVHGDYKYIYTMRRIIAAIASFIALSLIVLIIAAVRIFKK